MALQTTEQLWLFTVPGPTVIRDLGFEPEHFGRDTVAAIYFTLDHSKVAIKTTTFPHIDRTLSYIIACSLSIFAEKN